MPLEQFKGVGTSTLHGGNCHKFGGQSLTLLQQRRVEQEGKQGLRHQYGRWLARIGNVAVNKDLLGHSMSDFSNFICFLYLKNFLIFLI
ncbi:hypothetical protein D8674_009619 [Pyrus ussuriensis x Pyrus communis]|uniref:Uncharacterized protein n=1 Tax=Pyrus ussuriensis x Pyrus communis TaxID=2448454 RepID=A0A5N5F8G9_9ROSA|nr:hypothetical protein D8674_009619 [Pyrus ussuriensis x Pyrus communis]